jgi:hypothetical protein
MQIKNGPAFAGPFLINVNGFFTYLHKIGVLLNS